MHPELFELKALVAGRLDAHRRREIDDHLGSCADCSRHYVAMMLGSASPKTAEAEAREALVPTGAGAVLTLIAGGGSAAPAYGIDAPIAPPAAYRPVAPRVPHNNMMALETEFSAPSPRTPASASLVDAISRLRADAVAPARPVVPEVEVVEAPVAVKAPAPMAASPERVAQVAAPPLIAPSIFTPTPIGGVSLILPPVTPVATRAQPAPELVVTFSSTPPRVPTVRATATVAAIRPVAATVVTPSQEYVSQAVPTMASAPASEFELTTPVGISHTSKRPVLLGGAIAAAAVLLVVLLAGYKFFRSSVSDAASAAAAAATQQVEASARTPHRRARRRTSADAHRVRRQAVIAPIGSGADQAGDRHGRPLRADRRDAPRREPEYRRRSGGAEQHATQCHVRTHAQRSRHRQSHRRTTAVGICRACTDQRAIAALRWPVLHPVCTPVEVTHLLRRPDV